MNKYCWISFALVLLGHVGVSHQDCDEEGIKNCITGPISDVFNIGDAQSLETFCSTVNTVLQCLKKCATGDPEIDQLLFGGLEMFTSEMCKEGSKLAEDFLSQAKCIEGHLKDINKCDEESPIKVQYGPMFQFVEPASAADDRLKKACCAFYNNVDCKKNKLRAGCGDAAANVLGKIVMLIGGPVVKDKCSKFKPHCDAGTHLLPSIILTLGAAIVMLFYGFVN